jgi:hypothetical protein
MLSFPHQLPLELCRWRGDLAHELLRGRAELPEGELIQRHASGDLTQVVPVQYLADHVVTFHRPDERGEDAPPVVVVIIESQLQRDDPKQYSWPAYVGVAHSTWKCEVVLLVLTRSKAAAQWAKGPFGPQQMQLHPVVVNLDELPRELSEADALRMPELAVLVAIGHPTEETAKRAIAAIKQLPKERAELCFDAIMLELPPAVRKTLEEQQMIEDYEFGSVYALRFRDRAKREGVEEGRQEGAQEAKRESLAVLRRIALELMGSKLPELSTAQRSAIEALVDEAALATLISELGRASNVDQARDVVARSLAS